MKVLKEISTEFGNAYFLNSSHAADSTVIAIVVSPANTVHVGVIPDEVYEELIYETNEQIIFSFPYRSVGASDFIDVQLKDNYFEIKNSGSLDQEDLEYPCSKMEIIALTVALEFLKVPNLFKPFTMNYERVTDAFIPQKAFLNSSESGFTSAFSGKTYHFDLELKSLELEVHNWIVSCNGEEENQIWIAPIKLYITSAKRHEEFTSLVDLWDTWLIKQYAAKLSLQYLKPEWVTQGYHKLLVDYMDEVVYA